MKKNVVMTSTINVNIFYAHTCTPYTHSYPVHVHVLPPQINMTESVINDALVAEVKRLEKEFDDEEAAFKEYRAAFKEYRKVSEKNIETFNKLKLMHEKEVEKRIELEVVVEDREKEIKELKARLDKVISDNIELKQFKENYLERKRKKRKKSFPDVPP